MSTKSATLLNSIRDFYVNDEKNSQYLIDILEKRNGVSLRNIEWFITNYSKRTNLSYESNDGKKFRVHYAYKSSLDGYSKKLFDPFCRTEKIDFQLPNNEKSFKTTVAQLNFIKWCIKNKIIDYIMDNKQSLLSK